MSTFVLMSEHLRAGRALIGWSQENLASASGVSRATIKRLEQEPGVLKANRPTAAALQRALEEGGVELLNGSQPGVRLKAKGPATIPPDELNASNDE
jgi:transcriptional regulator with XRE-family HTH domain